MKFFMIARLRQLTFHNLKNFNLNNFNSIQTPQEVLATISNFSKIISRNLKRGQEQLTKLKLYNSKAKNSFT